LLRFEEQALAELDQLRADRDAEAAAVRRLTTQLCERDEESEEAARELARVKAEKKRQETEFTDRLQPLKERLQKEVSALELEVEQLNKTNAHLIEQKDAAEQACTAAKRLLLKAETDAAQRAQDAKVEIDGLKQCELDLLGQLSDARTTAALDAEAADTMQKQFAKYVSDHEQLTAAMKRQIEDLLRDLAQAKVQLADATTTNLALNQQIADQAKQLSELESSAIDKAAQLAGLMATAASAASTSTGRETDLGGQLADANRKLTEAETASAAQQRQIEALTEETRLEAAEIEEVKVQVANLRAAQAQMTSVIVATNAALEKRLREDEARRGVLQQAIIDLKSSDSDDAGKGGDNSIYDALAMAGGSVSPLGRPPILDFASM
jgi:hypothetical protein